MYTDLLNYAIAHDMIEWNHVMTVKEMAEKNKYLEMHPYKIYQGKDSYYYTYLPDAFSDKKRRRVKRKSQGSIEKEVIAYWKANEKNPTIKECFDDWNKRRLDIGKIKHSTFSRNEQIFKRHYSKFGKKRIKNVSEDEFCDFLEEQISEFDLTSRAFSNLKSITKGFLKRARKSKYITFNVEEMLSQLDVSDREFKSRMRPDESEIFYDDEVEKIISYCMEHTDDICCLGVALMFASGIRVGEAVALKSGDIIDGCIHVSRTETRYVENGHNIFEVSDYPKTPAGVRTVVVPSCYLWVLDELKNKSRPDEYIFIGRNGKRLHTQALRKRIYQICFKLDIRKRSPHKIRKTYGSILLDHNIDSKFIEKQMGHTSIACTEHYYHRDRRHLGEKRAIIDEVFE